MALLRAYERKLPALEAAERLAAINDHAVAAGNLQPGDRRRHIDQLRKLARGKAMRPKKANPAMLAAMGIGISPPPEKGVSDV